MCGEKAPSEGSGLGPDGRGCVFQPPQAACHRTSAHLSPAVVRQPAQKPVTAMTELWGYRRSRLFPVSKHTVTLPPGKPVEEGCGVGRAFCHTGAPAAPGALEKRVLPVGSL